MLVKLADVVFDAGTQVRAGIDESVVAQYAERMTEGDHFPPIVLFHDGSAHYLADGFHRLLAAQRLQWREIDALVHLGTKEDALWFALGANKANGVRLTVADVRHAIELAYSVWPDKGQREIAEQVGCSQRYVWKIRDEIQVTTGRHLPDYITGKDGKQYPASRGPNAKSQEKRRVIADMVKDGASPEEIAATVGVSMTTVTQVRREVGVPVGVDKSREAVSSRRGRMREMAADGYTSRQIAAELGLSEEGCRRTLRAEGIDVPADRVTRNSKHHDTNRILERMVEDAENLMAGSELIEFSEVDHERIAGWLDSLHASSKALRAFIRRLEQEQKKHGEAA